MLFGASSSAPDGESCISKLHKSFLSKFEEAAGGMCFKGLGAATNHLRGRVDARDKLTLKHVRALGEAFNFVRHLTRCGERVWLKQVDLAIGRLAAPEGAVGLDGNTNDVAGEMDCDSKKRKKKRCRKKKSRVAGSELGDEFADLLPVRHAALAESSSDAAPVGLPSGAVRRSRALAKQSSRERSPHRSGAAAAHASTTADHGLFQPGALVVFGDLKSRPELVGTTCTVLSWDASSLRYAVELQG